ncbi:hypothetical protein D0469_09610 [Peribacillus saganii]|uniref:Uncharacterized protein n=1 Tax=Peribacillus saganii TaxID=2303992 RepID=A0A372LPH5_9BACI|nr:hypothetical protein [Peribacillus saganii]RFU69464.1 hypothetical protein D0469_09610 [Peribacillus saganii]
MMCICEELDQKKYKLTGKIVIVEDKKTILKHTGLMSEDWMSFWEIDSRLLTGCFHSLNPDFDRIIVVYDYEAFCSDPDVREAILFHELGHITYPVGQGENNIEAEISCDQHAINNGFKCGLEKVLDLLLEMSQSLKNAVLADMTKHRLKMIHAG